VKVRVKERVFERAFTCVFLLSYTTISAKSLRNRENYSPSSPRRKRRAKRCLISISWKENLGKGFMQAPG